MKLYTLFYLFMPNGISHSYQLDQSISVLRFVGCKIVETDQRPRSVASDLGLHRLSMPHKKHARLVWATLCKINEYHVSQSSRRFNPFMTSFL